MLTLIFYTIINTENLITYYVKIIYKMALKEKQIKRERGTYLPLTNIYKKFEFWDHIV